MFASVRTMEGESGAKPAAILDVDGPLYQEDLPLGVEFAQYVFERTAGDVLDAYIDADMAPRSGYFEADGEDEWTAIREGLRGHEDEVFDPSHLEDMYDAWTRFVTEEEVDYLTAAREITKHWVDGIRGLEPGRVEDLARDFRQEELEDRVPDSVSYVMGNLEGRGYDVYLVSLNPQEILEEFADVAFAGNNGRSNVYGLEVRTEGEDGDEVYVRRLDRNMLDEQGKLNAVREIQGKSDLGRGSLALGDTEADLPVFASVENIGLISPGEHLDEAEIRERLEAYGDESDPTILGRIQSVLGEEGQTDKNIFDFDDIEEVKDRLQNGEEGGVEEALSR